MARVQTLNNVKEELKRLNRDYEGRKTWGQMYGSVDLSRQQALSSAKYDYSKALGEAYASSYAQRASVANSPLLSGYKQEAISDLDSVLEQAYNSYKTNYLSQQSSIEENAAKAVTSINDMLTSQAENVKTFQDKPYEYLSYLYDKAKGNDEVNPDSKLSNLFANDEQWKKYTVDVLDEKGEVTDERRLKTKEELWSELYDQDGNLTLKGADFYDQMFNQLGSELGSEYGFDYWVASNDEELYDWLHSYNAYDYSLDEYGTPTNMSSIKTMLGLASDDDKYEFIERFGGLSETEIDTFYKDFSDKLNEFSTSLEKASGRYTKETAKSIADVTKELKSIANRLGISDELEKEMGMTWQDLEAALDYNVANSVTNSEQWFNNIKNHAGAVGTAGSAIGGTVGSFIAPGVGTIGASAVGAYGGAVIGAISGIIKSSVAGWNGEFDDNLAYAQNSKNLYEDLLITMINYSKSIGKTKANLKN